MTAGLRGGPGALNAAIAAAVAGQPQGALTRATRDLITAYRSGQPPAKPVLATEAAVLAYAAYRMPATYAAVREVLAAGLRQQPELAPRTLLDVGGGTGAAAWAALATFPSLQSVEVVDASEQALRIGQQLIQTQPNIPGAAISWRRADLASPPSLPRADVAVVSYLLGELTEPVREALVANVANSAATIVIVEPGTPAGYRRVLSARQQLLQMDRRIVAPCPHHQACPLASNEDWCHFGVRLSRSPQHRRAKGAVLGHEDEKFSYLVATTDPIPTTGADRIIGRPRQRKGLVELTLCTREGVAHDATVSRRDCQLYRQARNSDWNGTWPPRDSRQQPSPDAGGES